MTLAQVIMGIILAGMALYVVLGGADFGAPVWQTVGARGPHADEIREQAHESMSPVWEANHVWLIFVLTVLWTAFPTVFGSIASTLSIPLFAAGVGIIIRGAAYALRTAVSTPRQIRFVDTMSAASSVLAPLALGMAVGGVASLRVPVGNAAGHMVSSWLNPTSIVIGVLAVATSAYLSAVFLCGDAQRRHEEPDLQEAFRTRALVTGAVAGALAVAGIAAGWGLAQNPVVLRGLTVEQAAAPQSTLVAVLVAVIGGGLILFPSLGLLFRLVLGGRLGAGAAGPATAPSARGLLAASRTGLLARTAAACLVVGIGMLNVAEAGWAHGVGV